jgi:hypothetical protein
VGLRVPLSIPTHAVRAGPSFLVAPQLDSEIKKKKVLQFITCNPTHFAMGVEKHLEFFIRYLSESN